jgi:hypothetical protein
MEALIERQDHEESLFEVVAVLLCSLPSPATK